MKKRNVVIVYIAIFSILVCLHVVPPTCSETTIEIRGTVQKVTLDSGKILLGLWRYLPVTTVEFTDNRTLVIANAFLHDLQNGKTYVFYFKFDDKAGTYFYYTLISYKIID